MSLLNSYYQFSQTPFSRAIPPHQLFPSRGHQEIQGCLAFALQERLPVLITGEVGAGKSTAVRAFVQTLNPNLHPLVYLANPARANLPDIDLDFCSRRRDKVLEYVRRTYGPEQVALAATISTMRPKSAVRETAKAYGLDGSRHQPPGGPAAASGWHPDPRQREQRPVEEIVAQVSDPRQKEVLRQAYQLLGQPHHLSVHPGGVVITPGPLTDVTPVQWAPKGFLITQFDHQDMESLGLPKLDLLGISALTVIADAAQLIRRRHHRRFDPATIPPDDRLTGELLARGDTIGVFQGESEGARKTLHQLQARSVRDLRRVTIKAIIVASRQRPFTGLRDLLTRVDLHPKEVIHLIQGGGLDGLGEHRAALLAEWTEIGQASSALQLA